jgi:hypothetical protein
VIFSCDSKNKYLSFIILRNIPLMLSLVMESYIESDKCTV